MKMKKGSPLINKSFHGQSQKCAGLSNETVCSNIKKSCEFNKSERWLSATFTNIDDNR